MRWIHVLSPILDKSLATYKTPKKIEDADFQENETYIIDGIERTIQRDTYEQGEFYSGKKKTHTVKNIVITNLIGIIIWAGQTACGKVHDKALANSIEIAHQVTIMADLGFQGWKPQGVTVLLPHKKPRDTKTEKRSLSEVQKSENKAFSSIRVKVEHVFSSVKVMRILKDRNRNYRVGYRDLIFQTACSLHNFRRTKRTKEGQKKENIC